jgi:antitoxin component HigA of HigAB toxin-antitoxin module
MITTEDEYQRALAYFDGLMDANTPEEMDELTRLADELVAYEEIHYPIDPPSLWEKIKFAVRRKLRL